MFRLRVYHHIKGTTIVPFTEIDFQMYLQGGPRTSYNWVITPKTRVLRTVSHL